MSSVAFFRDGYPRAEQVIKMNFRVNNIAFKIKVLEMIGCFLR